VSKYSHIGLLHLFPSLSLVQHRVPMREREVRKLVVLFVLVIVDFFKLSLMSQCLVSLDEVLLLLFLVFVDLLLVEHHFLSQVVQEHFILFLLLMLEMIKLILVLVDLADNLLQKQVRISLFRVELDPLGESLARSPFDKGRQERVRNLLLGHFLLKRRFL
jgi:hypothetical protein